MALRDLGPWLLDVPGFRRQVDRVRIDAACGELGTSFVRLDEHAQLEHDWRYLLLSASVLAQSEQGPCQEAALRITQTCLSDVNASDVQKDSAALVLDALANHPAIRLAEQRKHLKPELATRLPGAARLEYSRRGYAHSVAVHGNTLLRVNRFQRNLWDQIRNQAWMSVSAPTSAGKSFILAWWFSGLMRESEVATVVYLVPTRALISQVEGDLRKLFRDEGLFSLLKRLVLGTFHGSVSHKHFSAYLDEFVFRFNRRNSASRWLLFERIVAAAPGFRPPTMAQLTQPVEAT